MLACTEEYQFDVENNNEKLVVDAVLTSLNDSKSNYVRLTTLNNKISSNNNNGESNVKPITDAIVTIKDNLGNSETLTYDHSTDNYLYDPKGYYRINKLKGIVGRTYTLEIIWNNKKYTASSQLLDVTEINKITFREKYLESKKVTVTIPLLHFTEPQDTKNYYLLHYSVNGFSGSNRNWAYSVISDEHLIEDVNGLEIDDGQSGSGRDFYYEMHPGDKVVVYMESLTQEAYDFYTSLIKQFESDGGAFTQNPASPPGNISNGALGLFRCSDVSKKEIIR